MLGLAIWLLLAQAPPATRAEDVRERLHGVEVADPYRWLEDQESPETRAWIEAQNAYSRAILDSLPARAAFRRRLEELMRTDVTLLPVERGGRYFFLRKRADQEQFVLYLRRGRAGADEALIDPHPWRADRTASIRLMDVARDGTLAAYGVRQGGEDELEVRLFDVEARRDLPEKLPRARYHGLALQPDKRGFYYSRYTPEGPRVYHRELGSAGEREIFGRGYGRQTAIGCRLSEDGRRLILHVFHGSSRDRSDVFFLEAGAGGAVRPVVRDVPAAFFLQPAGEQFFVLTNWKAGNWRVLAGRWEQPEPQHWREVVPEGPHVIEEAVAAGGRLVVSRLENVRSRLWLYDAGGRRLGEIPLPGPGAVGELSGRWESGEVFYSFGSFHIPPAIYRLEAGSSRPQLWERRKVPVRSERFRLEQVWYRSKDGTKIPMFLLEQRGSAGRGARPALLTGYGGFNVNLTPAFSETAVAWVEQGGIFALANLRGGAEFGETWHRAGMLANKQNVFDDFLAAAEWLIARGYTDSSKLAIYGASNGGLLVGAAMTQRPELFAAVVCRYPLLDMLRYHRFLVARYWVSEYGSAEDPEQFRWLWAYSPYHRVREGVNYPAVLLVTGDADTRVAPLHARKMAARLQAAGAGERPVLLRYDVQAGHSAGLPVSKRVEDLADELAFLWRRTGGR
jgi:prolyl oligopeptidase